MEFLKAFFGDKAITYDELVQAINSYNGDEKNKEKLIKMVNLTDGGYVSKDKINSNMRCIEIYSVVGIFIRILINSNMRCCK